MQKWEYFAAVWSGTNANDLTRALDRLGVEGWELVGVESGYANGNNINHPVYTFKRPLTLATRLKRWWNS